MFKLTPGLCWLPTTYLPTGPEEREATPGCPPSFFHARLHELGVAAR